MEKRLNSLVKKVDIFIALVAVLALALGFSLSPFFLLTFLPIILFLFYTKVGTY